MFTLLTGYHPLYVKGDNKQSYIRKLKNPVWKFPPHFSPLAQTLFLKLVKINPLERYAASEALKHPWITRNSGPIPLSYADSIAYEHCRTTLSQVN